MSETTDILGRLTRLETQLDERYKNAEERYRTIEERYRTTEERYRTTEERYRTTYETLSDLKSKVTRIEALIQNMPASNGRTHLLHVSAASVGGGGIMAMIIELVRLLSG